MNNLIFSKYKQYIYYPDFAGKFLGFNPLSIHRTLNNYFVQLKFISLNRTTYNPWSIKALLVMEAIYPKKASSIRRTVKLKFGRKQYHIHLYSSLNLNEFLAFQIYFAKKPVQDRSQTGTYLRQEEQFVSPTIRLMAFPTWTGNLLVQYNPNISNTIFLTKSAFID